jgi:prepilin-type N-terminal cleavage/methylation domain-containing protein
MSLKMEVEQWEPQAGFTLVELMVTAAVMMVAFSLLSFAMSRSYRVVDSHNEIQSEARLALDTMAKDIRGAEQTRFDQPASPVSGTVVVRVKTPVSEDESHCIIYHLLEVDDEDGDFAYYELNRTERLTETGPDVSVRPVAQYIAAATAYTNMGASFNTVLIQLSLTKETGGPEPARGQLQTEVLARNQLLGG